ncbi:hypothetical protein AYI68_g2960 [Smittium mucronatum]|uniref:Protein FAF1 n=1 Tax=Smittium mucronatum TaxID=133383 RepID=A0A1R0H197_9FUNG|nr:hypothetical protein AYI68_g2960 [Smittium mucronatum]
MNIRSREGVSRKVQVVDATEIDKHSGKKFEGNTKQEYKTFMSSKIENVVKPKHENAKKPESKEEDEDKKKDLELKELLSTSRIIEELSNSAVAGKDRLNYMNKKMIQLGLDKQKKIKIPRDQFYIAQGNRLKKADREITQNRDRGILTNSVKRQIEEKYSISELGKKKHKKAGVNLDKGRFRNGTLFVSKAAIRKNENPVSRSVFRKKKA